MFYGILRVQKTKGKDPEGDQKMTKATKKKLLEIAKAVSASIDARGDLERRWSDSEDFIEVAVWSIEDMLEKAYELGKKEGK